MSDIAAVSIVDLLKDPANRSDPYPAYAGVAAAGRLVPTAFGGFAVPRHAEAFTVLRDGRFSSHPSHQPAHEQMGELAAQVGLGDLIGLMERLMLFADPPDHTRLRRIAAKAFTPRRVEAMRAHIGSLVDRLLDGVADDGGAELVETLAFPLPVTVISDLLGVPASDHVLLRGWTSELVKALDPADDLGVLFPAADAMRAMRAYFEELVAARRAAPGDDLLSALALAEDEGERLTPEELLDTTILLFAAGHETTVNLISGGVLNLLRHPGELARLRAEPDLMAAAVEELLRFGPPVQLTGRTATVDVELAGEEVAAGTELVVLLAAANRDPGVFPAPDRLDIGRRDNRHLAFGGGIHLCLGAPLARIEGQEAIGRLVRRFPDLALTGGDIEWKPTSTIRGPVRLPVTW